MGGGFSKIGLEGIGYYFYYFFGGGLEDYADLGYC
jgi:hypothetical protein